MSPKYTAEYDAAIESEIDSILEGIVSDIEKDRVAGMLEFVALGGGYGRGEGGILKTGSESRLYNDLDFFVITKDSLKPNDITYVDLFFAALSKKLSGRVGIDVDFSKPAKISYVVSRMSAMSWREMALCNRPIFGDSEKFGRFFTTSGTVDVPPCEFLKLAMNRAAGLLLAADRMAHSDLFPEDCDFVSRNANKAVLAAGDIAVATRGKLPFKTADRLKRIEDLFGESALVRAYKAAVNYKTNPAPLNSKAELYDFLDSAIQILSNNVLKNERFLLSTKGYGFARRLRDIGLMFKMRGDFRKIGFKFGIFDNPKFALAKTALSLSKRHFSPRHLDIFKKYWSKFS